MSQNVILPSFAAGELSPALYSRTDLAKYHVGAAILENFFVDFRGGAANRPGTMIVGECKSTAAVHLIPFVFNTDQTYVLEFGHQYIRFIIDGNYITTTAQNITNITQATPPTITYTGSDPANGTVVFIADVQGMLQINNTYVQVNNVNTAANTFEAYLLDGLTPFSAAQFSAYSAAGTFAPVYSIATPYVDADIPSLKYTQSADTMTITHVNYAPRDLVRSAHTNWSLSTISFGSNGPSITVTALTPNSAGSTQYAYAVSGVNDAGEEGIPANALNTSSETMSTTQVFIRVTFSTSADAVSYNVYRTAEVPGSTPGTGALYGYIGSIGLGQDFFVDRNIQPDFTQTAPIATPSPFTNNNPACSAYYQQRQVYAGSSTASETFYMSQPGARKNFNVSLPSKDSDAIDGTLSSQQVNAIQWLVPSSLGLLAFTSGSAFLINGGSGFTGTPTPITPSNASAVPQLFTGINPNRQPLIINSEILYIQSMGSVVRNFLFNLSSNNFVSQDLTVLSEHLFSNHTISDWEWAPEPDKIVWVCRDDGVLLSLTYLREQEVAGWAHHTTDGYFESVCSVQEGNESAVYFVVQRFVNNRWVKYIERLASRNFGNDISDAWFLDCALQNTPTTLTTGATVSGTAGSILVTANVSTFTSSDVGSWLKLNDGIVVINSLNSVSQVSTSAILNLSTARPISAGEWTKWSSASTFYGLYELEGEQVYALADGNVQGPFVVANSTCTISSAAHVVTIGKPYTATLQTLYLDTGDPTIQGKRKKISAASVRVKQTRGIVVGQPSTTLYPWKGANGRSEPAVVQGYLPQMTTGDMRVNFDPNQDVYGQVTIRQVQPWPATITGIIPEPTVGDDTR